jgi:hypothetical protein
MSFYRRAFAFLAAVLATTLAASAPAQTPPLGGATLTINSQGITHTAPRTGFRLVTQLNYADCIADDVITFGLSLGNRGTYPLQVWAGNNSCTTNTNRTTTTAAGCWLLYNALPSNNTPTIELHVRDILWGQTEGSVTTGTTTVTGGSGGATDMSDAGVLTSGTGGTGGSAGTTSVPTTSTLPTGTLIDFHDVNACTDNSGIPAVVSLAVTFMLIDPSNSENAVASSAWPATYKLLAPNPPDTVSAGVGDGLLPLHFSYVNNQSNDMTISGYQFFCDPPPGTASLADAGIVPVVSDTGVAVPNCGPSELLAGHVADSKFQCGSASLSATAGNATGLVNGVSYTVGVSATDTYANVGKLSTPTCQVPQPITGFFKAYRAAGGEGGGGYCSFSTKREPLPLFALLGLASCLALRRRRAT